MSTYTLKLKQHEQDNLNIIDFKPGDKFPEFLDYEEVLQFSIENGHITSEQDINCLVDGSDHVEPYFTSNTASEEAAIYVEDVFIEHEKYFNVMEHEYELFD